jgi:hypothetical protein
MLIAEPEEPSAPVIQAEENLRVIREMMERSTRYSTFSGISGILAGSVSILGCIIHRLWVTQLPASAQPLAFVGLWATVVAIAIGGDFLIIKRRAPLVGKTIISRLGKQIIFAAAPGLLFGALLTLDFLQLGRIGDIFPYWMLCYGCAVAAVGIFSQREVSRLGAAFLVAGGLTLLSQLFPVVPISRESLGLAMMALSFGGFHIVYGIKVARYYR